MVSAARPGGQKRTIPTYSPVQRTARTTFEDRAGHGHAHHAAAHAHVATEAMGLDRHRLGPAERHAQQRQEQRAHRVDVGQRIQRHSAHQRRRVVAQPPGRPRMGPLMDAQREPKRNKKNNRPASQCWSNCTKGPFVA